MRGAIVPACVALCALSAPARATTLPPHAGLFLATGPTGATPRALPMLDSTLSVTIRGPLVEVVVTQHFENRLDHAVEAVYVFPLPADAAVSAMSMRLGVRTIHAAIERRDDAKRRYEAAVTAGVGAGLLEQERPDVFTQTVSAIPAHGNVEVTLRYDATAVPRAASWELVLPMVVAPRFVPGSASGRPTTGAGRMPDTDRAPDASRVTPAADPDGRIGPTAVTVAFADPVDELASPTHDLTIAADHLSVRFVDAHSDHDAVLRWRAPTSAVGWVEQDGADAFAAVVVDAPAVPAPAPRAPASWLIVLDRAATTRGDPDAQLHPLVRAVLAAIDAHDRVAVIGSDAIAARPPAGARAALDARWPTAAGAFDLTRVLTAAHPGGAAMILISDGLVADDAAAIAAARALGTPIHVIGIGPAPARGLLAAIASATAGTLRFAAPGDDPVALARDVIADAGTIAPALAINWGTLAARDVVPAALPRLGTGQAMIVVARVGSAAARANGRVGGDVFAIEPLRASTIPDGATSRVGPLARRWARLHLDDLLAARHPDVAAITAHALAFGLVSPYTAMVAIGTDVVVEGGVKHSVAVPVAVPAGMRWQDIHAQLALAENETRREDKPVVPEKPAPDATKAASDAKHEPHAPGEDASRMRKLENVPVNDPYAAPTTPPVTPTVTPTGTKTATKTGTTTHATPKPQPVPKPMTKPTGAPSHHAVATPAPAPTVVTRQLAPPKPDDAHDEDGDRDGTPDTGAALGARAGGDDYRSTQPAPAPAPPTPMRTAAAADDEAGDAATVSTESLAYVRAVPGRSWRLALGVVGGVELPGTHGLLAIDARFDHGDQLLLGADASLWLVDAVHPQGHVLATLGWSFDRRWFRKRLELAAGAGVQLARDVGPAYGVALRFVRFVPHVPAIAVRYDGAVLIHDGGTTAEHALTLDVEWRWW